MKRPLPRVLSAIFVIFTLYIPTAPVAASAQPAAGNSVVFERGHIALDTANGRKNYNVEIATNNEQMEHGLMHRASLPENAGMLFIFPKGQAVTMWMKNTLIPLDMLFIDKQGKVIYIKHNALPESLDLITAGSMEVRAVLELNGGTSVKDNINIGDKIIYKAFKK